MFKALFEIGMEEELCWRSQILGSKRPGTAEREGGGMLCGAAGGGWCGGGGGWCGGGLKHHLRLTKMLIPATSDASER